MFTGLRVLCFSLIVFSVTAANAQFGGPGWGRPRPPGWGHPRPPGPPMPPFPPPPPPVSLAVDVYRFFGPDHLMTTNYAEGANNFGYRYEGVAFSLWNDDGRGTRVPLFRCYIPGRAHFVSNDWNCQGQVREGLLGFADRGPSGWSPREVVHCSNGFDHLATVSRQECYGAGYQVYETLGFVR